MGKALRAHRPDDGHGLCPLPILRLITTTHLQVRHDINNEFPQPLPLFEAANGGRHVGQVIALANQGNDLPVG
jgi:hypothetical protein